MTIPKKTIFYLLPLFVILIDRVTKLAAVHYLKDTIRPNVIIPGFLNFIYSTNRGALFGLFNNVNESLRFFLLTLLPLLVIIVIVWMLIKSESKDRLLNFGLSLILGGAIGNLIDRVMYREVIDFIDFYIQKFHWHTFNLADASITTGLLIILYQLIFMKPEKS